MRSGTASRRRPILSAVVIFGGISRLDFATGLVVLGPDGSRVVRSIRVIGAAFTVVFLGALLVRFVAVRRAPFVAPFLATIDPSGIEMNDLQLH
jgi:hypothetical protein